jgi:hypothetical protein
MALPHVFSTSSAAERGTAIHAYLEAVQNGVDPETALENVPEDWRPVCAAIELERLPRGLAAEVAFAYDLEHDAGRELGRGLERSYEGLSAWELAGTADVVGVAADAVYVGDAKTGWTEPTPAERNGQLLFLALAAARAYEKPSAVVEIIRVKETGAIWRDRAELDEFDLDCFADELAALRPRIHAAQAQAAEQGEPDVALGPHCRYCPAFTSCPAQRSLVMRLASGAEFDAWEALKPLSPAAAGQAWERLKVIEPLVRRVKESVLAARAEYGELPLPSGKFLREVIEPGNEQLDGRVVFAVIRDRLGPTVADDAVEIAASKASIDRALKKAAAAGDIKPRTGAKWGRDLLADIRDRGGASKPERAKLVEAEVSGVLPAATPAPAQPEPAAAVSPAEAGEVARVRAMLETGLEVPPDMQALHKTIRAGMERDTEAWSPLLLLWGQLNEALKERAA